LVPFTCRHPAYIFEATQPKFLTVYTPAAVYGGHRIKIKERRNKRIKRKLIIRLTSPTYVYIFQRKQCNLSLTSLNLGFSQRTEGVILLTIRY
jgi:hypothetical protein